MKEFDENEAIAAMRKVLGNEANIKYSDDELLNLIDIIWDFYEQNGLLDLDLNDDSDDDDILPDLIDYAQRMIRKDRMAVIAVEDVALLVKAEIAYEDSLFD